MPPADRLRVRVSLAGEWGREARHYEFSCPSQVNSGHKAPRLEVCVNVNVLCVFSCRLHITHKTEKALLIDSF